MRTRSARPPARTGTQAQSIPTHRHARCGRISRFSTSGLRRGEPVEPKVTSRADPAAQWTGAQKGHAFFAYATNCLIDTDNAVIVDGNARLRGAAP
jgi:hypothetical protein